MSMILPLPPFIKETPAGGWISGLWLRLVIQLANGSRFYSAVAAVAGGPIISLQVAAPLAGALGNSVAVGINQLPTLDPANITVTLV